MNFQHNWKMKIGKICNMIFPIFRVMVKIHFSSASIECLHWVKDPYSSASVGGKNMILQEQEELTKLNKIVV